MTKFFNPAIPIRVQESSNGYPIAFTYNRKPARVRQINRQWRIREGWWRDEAAREYFQLETSRFVCMVYRDMITADWYLQRIYD